MLSTETDLQELAELVRYSDLRNFESDQDVAEVILLHREEFLKLLGGRQ